MLFRSQLYDFFGSLWNQKEYYYFAYEVLKVVERLNANDSLLNIIAIAKKELNSVKRQYLVFKAKSQIITNFGVKFTIDSLLGKIIIFPMLFIILHNYLGTLTSETDSAAEFKVIVSGIVFGFYLFGAILGMSNVIDLYRIFTKSPIPRPNKEWILRLNDFIILVTSFFLIGKMLKISALIVVVLCVYSSVMALFLFLPWVILNGRLDMRAGYFLNQFQNTNIKTVVGKMTLNLILSVWLLHLLQNPIFLILVKNGIK